jgi:aromatic ring-opening dioxygenase catalytic subunit (LigB family)
MGSIVGAALVSHVPTLVLPEAQRRALNDGVDTTLHSGLHELRRERLDVADPDTIVVFDGHWATTVETVVTAHERRSGRYTSEELPRGMAGMPYDFPGDPELAHAFAATADRRDDTWITAIDDPYLPIHYPTTNLLPFLQGDERWVSVSIVQTGEVDDFLLAGRLLAEAIAAIDRRVVLLASAGLSHRFWPLRQFRDHEGADPSLHLRTPEARAADEQVLDWMRVGDHAAIIGNMPEYRTFAPEAKFGHYLLMAGAMGGADWRGAGTQFGEYEAVAGTGQAHVWFDA